MNINSFNLKIIVLIGLWVWDGIGLKGEIVRTLPSHITLFNPRHFHVGSAKPPIMGKKRQVTQEMRFSLTRGVGRKTPEMFEVTENSGIATPENATARMYRLDSEVIKLAKEKLKKLNEKVYQRF